GERLSHARAGRGIRARPRARADPACPPRGRPRLQPQGPGRNAGELLLQRAPARGERAHPLERRPRGHGARPCVARPRVVQRDALGRSGRVGLAGREPRWRRRPHGLPHPRPEWLRALVGRDVAHARRRTRAPRGPRHPLSSAPHLEIAAHRHRLPDRDGCRDRRPPVAARPAHGRPGARRAREHGHALLGRRGTRRRARWPPGPRLPGAHRIRGAAAVVSAPDGVRDEIGHIPGIDGLRGIAVLWVALFHFLVLRPGDAASRAIAATPAGPLAANGYRGVDLFFIISGFLLAMPWFVHAAAHRESPSVLAFYRRRFWRIVPAYYVQLAILFGLVLPALRGVALWRSDLYVYLYNLVTHALFLHNTTPLSSGSMQVNGALWTLAVEAQFYLLLPLAMPVVVRWPRASLLAAIAAAQAWRVAAEVDLVPLVRLEVWLGRPWGWPEDVVRHLLAYQLPSYLGHFALGMYLGREWLSRRAAPARPGVPDAAAAMAIVALGISLVQGWPPGRFAWTAAPLALCVLLYAAARGGTWTS